MSRLTPFFRFAVFVVIAGVTMTAQSQVNIVSRPDGAVARAGEWVTSVLEHQPGIEDAAFSAVARWDKTEVDSLLVELASIRALMQDPFRKYFVYPIELDGGRPKEIRYSRSERETLDRAAARARQAHLNDSDLAVRAMVLHTDIARLSGLAGTVFSSSDGQQMTLERRRADHWAMARALGDTVKRKAGRDSDLAFWYRASLAYMVSVQMWNSNHALGALRRFDDDPALQFLVGCQHEILAAPRTQASVAVSRLPAGMGVRVSSASDELNAAASAFKRTLDRDDRNAEARLRFGRLLAMNRRSMDAIRELRRASAMLEPPEQRYYAQLFLGAALEDAKDPVGAGEAYQQAARLFPDAQAPRLALSQLAASRGDWSGAATAIAPVLSRSTAEERHDPWWTYFVSCGRNAETLLIEASRRLMTPRG